MTDPAAELDARLATAYGVKLETEAWLPDDDSDPDAFLRAAESIGRAVGDSRARELPITERAWFSLPARPVVRSSPGERKLAIARLLAWAEAGGARWDGLAFAVDADGNAAVRASRALSPGELLLALPRHLMIVDNELAASTTGQLALGLPEPRPRDALAAWLPLEARAPASRWRAYLEALPVQLAELPMFHDASELAALAGTAAYALAADDHRDVRGTYDQLASELRARISLADFAWGSAIVTSRAYHAPGTLEHRVALLPLVELFNHGVGDTTWRYEPIDGVFWISAERGFATGDEVHFSYGDRSNTHLFGHFGFVQPNNPVAEADLLFDRATDPVADVAAHLLWTLPLAAPTRVGVTCRFDHRFVRALSLARLRASGPSERARALEVGLFASGDLPWLGDELERAALAELAGAARRALALIAAPAPPAPNRPWHTACSIVRASERAALEQILEFASTAAEHLSSTEPASLRAAAAEVPPQAVGARHLLRAYLRALADELT
jgi:hypothetical protein